MTMTSVMGHLMELDFTEQFSKWQSCSPAQLFHAPIVQRVPDVRSNIFTHNQLIKDKKSVAANLKAEARHARVLIIWTDCDREGESIGSEIVQICSESNPRLEVLRARFSVVQRGEIVHAINNLVPLDMKLADAVRARSELDLRVGSAFTRFQTLRFQNAFPELQEKIISYGTSHSYFILIEVTLISNECSNFRILPISNAWLCGGAVLEAGKFYIRALLVHQFGT